MQTERIAVAGVDLAKRVFQIHCTDARGKALLRRQLTRAQLVPFFAQLPACLVGMEACGGAHYWARKIRALGHDAKLMAPQFVKPYVKTNKDDRADAEAIAEAVTRPGMRFVAIKDIWQQDLLMVHRVRERLVKARTALTNEIRGLLQEYGIIFPEGKYRLHTGLLELLSSSDERLSGHARRLIQSLFEEWTEMEKRIKEHETTIMQTHRLHETCRKLEELPGIGPITATALIATVGDAGVFKNGRQLSAFLGLVPRHDGTGGKVRMKGISKRGDSYVRKLLVHGARSVLRAAQAKPQHHNSWVVRLSKHRGFNKACVALANKNARKCWAIMAGRKPREAKERRSLAEGCRQRVIHSAPSIRAPGFTGNPRAAASAPWITLEDESRGRPDCPQSLPPTAGVR